MDAMLWVLAGVVWATTGHLLLTHRLTPEGGWLARAVTALWWATLWPMLVVVLGVGTTPPDTEDDDPESLDNLADPARIAELEIELGLAVAAPVAAPATLLLPPPRPVLPEQPRTTPPKQLPHLPGASGSACTLPTISAKHEFDTAFGYTLDGRQSVSNLKELRTALADLSTITEQFGEYADTHTGPDVLAMAKLMLRRIERVEGSLAPIFAGLTYADYGRARMGCLQARAAIGDIVDRMAMAGRL